MPGSCWPSSGLKGRKTMSLVSLTRAELQDPCCGGRPDALADACAIEGLDNCSATIRGLLEERKALLGMVRAIRAENHQGQRIAYKAALDLLRRRDLLLRD